MSTTVMQDDRSSSGMWEVTTRVIVYAAIGAALYGVAAVFSFLIPGTANVSVRPAFALVTFFGFAFGPIVGFFTGFVGNAIADQISGWGLLTSWNWSLANGLAGLLAGVFGVLLAARSRIDCCWRPSRRRWRSSSASCSSSRTSGSAPPMTHRSRSPRTTYRSSSPT